MSSPDTSSHDPVTVVAIAAAAFAAYLLIVDGAASAFFLHRTGSLFTIAPKWSLLTITAVRVCVEFLAGIIALIVLTKAKLTPAGRLFWLIISLDCLLGVGEMIVYTGALDEHHFFGLLHYAGLIRALTVVLGTVIYIFTLFCVVTQFQRLNQPITPLLLVIFTTPIILIICYFILVPDLRLNLKEYLRFMVYYVGANAGLFAIPKILKSRRDIYGYDLVGRNNAWILCGLIGALAYIFQNNLRHLLGIHWF